MICLTKKTVISLMMKQAISMMQVRARAPPRLPDYGCK